MNATYTAVFTECEEGGYAVTVDEIPIISTQGDTLEEAQQNLIYAIEDHAALLRWEREQEQKTRKEATNSIQKIS